MKYLFILNPNAGKKNKTSDLIDLIGELKNSSDCQCEFAYTGAAGDATRLAREAAHQGFDVAVAVGGDGTINEVAAGLIQSRCALGVVPRGSGNGIARSMNIPLSLRDSLLCLFSPLIRRIDVGMAGDKYFVGVAGCGFDAVIGRKFQSFGSRGPLPYFLIGAREFLRYKTQQYRIEIDGEIRDESALLLAFANTRQYGNGAIIAPDADPADGILDFCMIKSLPAWKAPGLVSMIFKGQIDQHPSYEHIKCKSVRVKTTAKKVFFHRDGEPDEEEDSLKISLLPAALRICLPAR
jgi:diacylglycerol kinase (ATP)